jgi:hypothetical protein
VLRGLFSCVSVRSGGPALVAPAAGVIWRSALPSSVRASAARLSRLHPVLGSRLSDSSSGSSSESSPAAHDRRARAASVRTTRAPADVVSPPLSLPRDASGWASRVSIAGRRPRSGVAALCTLARLQPSTNLVALPICKLHVAGVCRPGRLHHDMAGRHPAARRLTTGSAPACAPSARILASPGGAAEVSKRQSSAQRRTSFTHAAAGFGDSPRSGGGGGLSPWACASGSHQGSTRAPRLLSSCAGLADSVLYCTGARTSRHAGIPALNVMNCYSMLTGQIWRLKSSRKQLRTEGPGLRPQLPDFVLTTVSTSPAAWRVSATANELDPPGRPAHDGMVPR